MFCCVLSCSQSRSLQSDSTVRAAAPSVFQHRLHIVIHLNYRNTLEIGSHIPTTVETSSSYPPMINTTNSNCNNTTNDLAKGEVLQSGLSKYPTPNFRLACKWSKTTYNNKIRATPTDQFLERQNPPHKLAQQFRCEG